MNQFLEEFIRLVLKEEIGEIIWNPPIDTKKYIRDYSKHITSADYSGKKVGKLDGYDLAEEKDGSDFRIYLINPKNRKSLGGVLFKRRGSGGYEVGLASVDESLRGSGIATRIILKAMALHPEVPWWSSGTLVSELGLKMMKRLSETGAVNMWLASSFSKRTNKNLISGKDDAFWQRPIEPRKPRVKQYIGQPDHYENFDDPKKRKFVKGKRTPEWVAYEKAQALAMRASIYNHGNRKDGMCLDELYFTLK